MCDRMDANAKSTVSIIMGVIIILADLYWIYTSYIVPEWLYLGIIILVASLIWLGMDISLRRGKRR